MSAPLGKGQIPSLPALTLRRVAKDLRALSYLPTSWKGLLGSHSQVIQQQLEPLLVEMVKEGAHPRLMALLLERVADAQESLQAERNAWSFVCSGPDPLHSQTADSYATVDQLDKEARRSLLIATYNIGLSSDFKQLYGTIAERLRLGQLERVDLFFHPIQIADQLGADPMAKISSWFNTDIWPWPAKPRAYVDSRLINGSNDRCFQHAKVVVADSGSSAAKALVTSANFSEAAQRHNFEAGWLVCDQWRVSQVQQHFDGLVADGLFVEVLG